MMSPRVAPSTFITTASDSRCRRPAAMAPASTSTPEATARPPITSTAVVTLPRMAANVSSASPMGRKSRSGNSATSCCCSVALRAGRCAPEQAEIGDRDNRRARWARARSRNSRCPSARHNRGSWRSCTSTGSPKMRKVSTSPSFRPSGSFRRWNTETSGALMMLGGHQAPSVMVDSRRQQLGGGRAGSRLRARSRTRAAGCDAARRRACR